MTHRPLCFTLVAALLIVIALTAATPLYVSACPVEEAPEIPNEMANPYPVEPFASIFTLTADWRVGEVWDSTAWVDFQTRIIDADSTNTADKFPLVWDYFASTDQNPAYGAINLNGVTKIPLHLYFCPGCANFTAGNSIYLQAANPDSTISSPSTVVGISRSFTHELCHAIINMTGGAPSWLNEGLSTASEYVSGSRWEELATSPYNTEYDRSLRSYGTNLDPPDLGPMDKLVTYNLWSTFNAYLMAHFGGPDGGREDDLIYNWLRPHSDGGFTYQLYGLAVALDSLSTVAPTAYPVGSGTKSEKLGRLFHRSVMARYADEDSLFEGRYGLGADVSARSFRLFRFVDTVAMPTRVLPPMFVVGQPEIVPNGQADVSDFLCTRGSLPEACRLRDLGLHSWGAEYLIFRADSAYVAQGIDRTLHVELKTERALQTSERVRVGYLAYASADSVLYDKPLVSVLEEAPITVSEEGATASIEIPEFGGAVQGVVVVVSLVPDPIPASELNFTDNYCSPPTCPDCSYTGREPTLKLQVSYELENRAIPVPSDAAQSLQVGIDKAGAGDTLLVGDSEGFGPITVDKALMILPSTSEKQSVTASTGPAATITAGHVEGLRFVGSSGESPVVLVDDSGASLERCEVVGGVGSTHGIKGDNVTGIIRNVTVEMDSASAAVTGILLTYSSALVESCAVSVSEGTGICVGGTVEVSGCSVTAAGGEMDDVGIRTTWDHPHVHDCLVSAPGYLGGFGIEIWDYATVERCTIHDVQFGVVDAGQVGTVRGCLVSGSSECGFFRGEATYCIADGEYGFYPPSAMGAGSVHEDPLLCDPASGEFTLRVDSYGNPENNAFGQIGAFPVACMYDTLARDAGFAGHGILEMPGDVTVPSDMSLTLGAGTTIQVATTDNQQGGGNQSRSELIVLGALNVIGSSSDTVRFQSGAAEPSEGDWYGLRIENGAEATIEYAKVRDAVYGLRLATHEPSSVTHSRFSNNQTYDILVAPSTSGLCPFRIAHNTITVGGGTGIEFSSNVDGADVDSNTVFGDATSYAGIEMGTGTESQTVDMTANSISGFSNGAGVLETFGAALTMVRNSVSGSKWGVKVVRGSPAIGTTSSESDNYITGNVTGVYAEKPSGGSTTPVIRNNYIASNTYGVQAKNGALPDLGTGTNNQGNNYLAGNSTYCIWNRNTGSPPPQVSAEYNYFGECDEGNPPYCVYGNVDDSNGLCMEPERATGFQMVETPLPAKGLRITGVSPNPMLSGGEIHLSLEQGRTQVKLDLFDVTGRLVRSFGALEVGPGQHLLHWDGLNEQGVPVRSGIYFVRGKSTDGQQAGARILVTR